MKKVNVLIFPSGAENAINVFDSLKYNLHFQLFGATTKNDHSSYIFDEKHLSIGDYNIRSKSFINNFNKLIKKWHIDFIIPTHDEISLFLMECQDLISATVVCSPVETCRIAFSKISTFDHLAGKDYVAKTYQYDDDISFPVFIKPDIGAGGKDSYLVTSRNDLKKYVKKGNFLISEYLPGEEITVDCFTDRNRNLLFIGPRTRERITTGVSFKSSNVELSDDVKRIANDLNNTFSFRGLWFFQLKKDKQGKYKLMEICVRSAGTMALYRELGINFAALSLFDFMNYDVSVLCNSFDIELDRYYKSCYKVSIDYDCIYLDFDDTLLIDGMVNSDVMKLVYQWLNNNKKIYLVTKHSTDIYEDLKKYHIAENIFEEIIIIPLSDKKANYIKNKKAIFIDNYFFERKEVYDRFKIPVFDVDAVECLVNYNEL